MIEKEIVKRANCSLAYQYSHKGKEYSHPLVILILRKNSFGIYSGHFDILHYQDFTTNEEALWLIQALSWASNDLTGWLENGNNYLVI